MTTFSDVASLLEISPQFLRQILYETDPKYNDFTITKKSGEPRKISAPVKNLKIIQEKLKYILEMHSTPKSCAQGYIKGRGIKINASKHVKSKVILNIDLKSFFPSITFRRVYGVFRAKPFEFNSKVAATIANICCYNDSLPQGSPTSPIISNLICGRLDSQIMNIVGKYKCYYTRYADDLTISTKLKKMPSMLEAELDHQNPSEGTLAYVIKQNGFNINLSKVKLLTKSHRQQVTGIVTNEKLNVKREYYRNIRAVLKCWEMNGYDNAKKIYNTEYKNKLSRKCSPSSELGLVIKGQIDHMGYIKGINDTCYIKLLKKLNDLEPKFVSIKEYNEKIKPHEEKIEKIRKALWVIESTSGDGKNIEQGTAFPLEGSDYLVTADHCILDGKTVIYRPSFSGFEFEVSVIKRFPEIDIAFLMPLDDKLKYEKFQVGDSTNLKITDKITVCGFPNHNGVDEAHVVTSSLGSKTFVFNHSHLSLSHGIVSGASGGPVIDGKGRVVGVAVRGSMDFSENRNKNLAIPIEEILQRFRTLHIKNHP